MPDQNQTTYPPLNSEPGNNAKEEKARHSRRRSRQFLGLVLAILIVIGLVSIIQRGATMIGSMLNDEAEYQEYMERIDPLVWFDTLPFDDLKSVDQDALLETSIWGLINQVGAGNVSRNARGETLLASIDLDRYAAALYGPDFQFKHHSFEDPVEGLSYTYDEETQLYTIPSTSITPAYLGTVVDIRRESGGVKRVIVGYVSTRGRNDEIIATPDYNHPARYMDFLFQRDAGEYYLFALQKNTDYVPPEDPEGDNGGAVTASSSTDGTVPDSSELVASESTTPSSSSDKAESASADSSGSEG